MKKKYFIFYCDGGDGGNTGGGNTGGDGGDNGNGNGNGEDIQNPGDTNSSSGEMGGGIGIGDLGSDIEPINPTKPNPDDNGLI